MEPNCQISFGQDQEKGDGMRLIKEYWHLIIQCIICWCHGFRTKTGAEPWLLKQALKENARHPPGSQMNPARFGATHDRKWLKRLFL
jgi:hypothetical protein